MQLLQQKGRKRDGHREFYIGLLCVNILLDEVELLPAGFLYLIDANQEDSCGWLAGGPLKHFEG